MDEPVVCREAGTSYTCIRVSVGATHTTFIPMASLQVEKLENREFAHLWKPFETYPVGRAAKLYLGSSQYREIAPKARELLTRIEANPATPVQLDLNPVNQVKKEPEMATTTKNPAATKKTAPTKEAPAAKKAAPTKEAPAKQAPAAKKAAPAAKQAAPAAKKTAPTKEAPAAAKKAAPGKQAVAQAAKALAKGPGKQAAPAAKKPAGRPANDQKLKVADPDAPRRGATAEFVEVAKKLKTFTRQQLIDAMVAAGKDAAAARIKVADCVYFEIFVAA